VLSRDRHDLVDRHLDRLRVDGLLLGYLELLEQVRKLLTQAEQLGSKRYLACCPRLRRAVSLVPTEVADSLSGARNGVALVVEQLAN
jgi:hypothetical protein